MSYMFYSLLVSLFFNYNIAKNAIVGKWQNEDKTVTVQIYESGGKFFGKVLTLKTNANRKDVNNPDAKKRGTSVLGMVVLKNLVFDSDDDEWDDGTVYNPNNGETYDCKIWLKNNNTLMGRGYYGIFYYTQEWTRVK